MTFRLRPSSKRSNDTQHSLVQFPKQSQTFISNQVMTIKQLVNKVQMLQNNINMLNDGIRKQRQLSNAGYIDVQKRLDILEYKSFSNEKDLQQLAEINRNNFSSLPPLKRDPSNGQSLGKNEIAILKQTLLQQRQNQKQQSKHMSQTMQQLSLRQLRLQQELREMFNRTRIEYQDRLADQQNQLQKIDQYKMRKVDQQYQMMKENMAAVERRIVEELQTKIRKQTVLKDYIASQIDLAKQELLQQQKQLISSQTKMTRDMKQSLESLFNMITQIKSSFGEELSQTQELTTNNIKRLAMNLDVIDGKFNDRIKQIEEQTQENGKEIINFRQWVVSKLDQNREIVMGLQQQAIQRMQTSQKRSDGFEGSSGSSGKIQQKFKHLLKDVNSFKQTLQQKNFSIFKQISQSLKQLKLDTKKQNDQYSSQLISLTQSLKTLKKSLPNDMKKISQTIVTIFNDEFDVLAEQLDLLTQMIKVSKIQTQKFTKQQIKKHKQQFLQEIKTLILSSKKQTHVQLQKSIIKSQQSFKSSLQKESTYVQSLLNQKIQRLENLTQDIQSQSKKLNTNTNTQLENFTLSMKQFNQNYKEYLEQQRKDDMKKRIQMEQSMRKNASNLMEIAYKKSEFLVQGMKKAIQMNQMKKDLQIKQNIQGLKDDLARSNQHNKQQLFTQLKSLQQKISTQRQSSEQQLQQSLNQAINSAKRSLNIELGNTKLQIGEKITQMEKQINQNLSKQKEKIAKVDEKLVKVDEKLLQVDTKLESTKKELQDQISKSNTMQTQQIQKHIKGVQVKVQNLQKTLTQKTNVLQKTIQQKTGANIKTLQQKHTSLQHKHIELQKSYLKFKQQQQQQKLNSQKTSQTKLTQLQQQLKQQIEKQFVESAQKSQQEIKQFQQTLNTLRQTVWKLEAMNFSEQAKNKAIFDKMNEDLNKVTVNLDSINKQIQAESKKKQA